MAWIEGQAWRSHPGARWLLGFWLRSALSRDLGGSAGGRSRRRGERWSRCVAPLARVASRHLRRTAGVILWRHDNGAGWRTLPAERGPWWMAAQTFIRWACLGVWGRLLALVQERGLQHGMTFLDAAFIRAHPRAAGAALSVLWTHMLAERVGFEPTVPAKAQRFSRPPRSTTLAPLRSAVRPGPAAQARVIVGRRRWKQDHGANAGPGAGAGRAETIRKGAAASAAGVAGGRGD